MLAVFLARAEVPDKPLLGLEGTATVSRRRLETSCLRCFCDSGPVALPVLYSDASGPVLIRNKVNAMSPGENKPGSGTSTARADQAAPLPLPPPGVNMASTYSWE